MPGRLSSGSGEGNEVEVMLSMAADDTPRAGAIPGNAGSGVVYRAGRT